MKKSLLQKSKESEQGGKRRKPSRVVLSDAVQLKGQLTRDSSEEILNKHNIKKLSLWFHSWHPWQKRLLVCTVMNCCSKQQLAVLATSLEPILHMDFSSSLLPPLQSLHLDGVATFHVQRAITKKVASKVPLEKIDSRVYLNSLPSTFDSSNIAPFQPSSSDVHPKPSDVGTLKEKREPLLPMLPLSHPEHLQPPGLSHEASFSQLLDYRRQRFSSVPDFRSTMDLLKKCGRKQGELGRKSGGRARLAKSKTITAQNQLQTWGQRTEQFKEQLGLVTDWMSKWENAHKARLVSELVKLCDKNLLGYFVQCLYQQLQDIVDINSVPDCILIRIFEFLSPQDLGRAAQVCKNWNRLANMGDLWKRHTYALGVTEGIGDVGNAMETIIKHYRHFVSPNSNKDPIVDWKIAFRDLRKLVGKLKVLVMKKAEEETDTSQSKEEAGSSDYDSDLRERLRASLRSPARNRLSLIEMLEILRLRCPNKNPTTQDLYMMAGDSASAKRRMLRVQRIQISAVKARMGSGAHAPSSSIVQRSDTALSPKFGSMKAWTPTHNLEFAQHLIMSIRNPTPPSNLTYTLCDEKDLYRATSIHTVHRVVERAFNTYPKTPMLPDPAAITALVLSGGLLGTYTPKPGKIAELSDARRLEKLGSMALCMQCDARKIVLGNLDRTIIVIDIRSGRTVNTLHGHKGSVQCLQFDDYKIVSGSWDTCCIVWDVVHHTVLKQLTGHRECVSCLNFNDDILVTGSHDGSVRVWCTASWDTICTTTAAHTGGVLCLQLGSKTFATGGVDKKVKVWSMSSYLCLGTLEQTAPVTAVKISHLLLTSSSIDGAVHFWNLDTLEPVMKMQTNNGAYMRQLVQHQYKYFGAGSDGVIYELDLSTGTCIRILTGHSVIITAISVVDYKLVSTSADRTLVIWSLKRKTRSFERNKSRSRSRTMTEDGNKDEEEEKESEKKKKTDEGEGEGTGEEEAPGDEEVVSVYEYEPLRFYEPFSVKTMVDNSPECCGFSSISSSN